MIFYFSGTGNSLYAAKYLAQGSGEEVVSIAAALNSGAASFEYTLQAEESVGFVFPVYAWGPTAMALEFVGRMELANYRDNYVFAVITCGGAIGKSMDVFREALQKKGLPLHSGFSVAMNSNYILMGDAPGREEAAAVLNKAEEKLREIREAVGQKARGIFKVAPGPLPGLLTSLVYPMFNKHALTTKSFYANDKCNGCGICARVCNTNTITVTDNKPQWGERCSQCLACLNLCPVKAIQSGKGTEKKGRYANPRININELFLR